MNELPKILSYYMKIVEGFERELTAARQENQGDIAERIRKLQILNDQAYFLLCWGQIEKEIDDTCRRAVRKQRVHRDWQKRRAWELFNPDDKRFSGLSFYGRAKLVLDVEKHEGLWKLLMHYYGMRNQIAHGVLPGTRIEI